jgi:hypothetical protein
MIFSDEFLDNFKRKERRKIEDKMNRQMKNQLDPDISEAQKILDAEFPGAEYDESVLRFISQKKTARRFKKRAAIFSAKFIGFAGLSFWIVSDTFPLSFADYLTIAAGAAVFAFLPLKAFIK